MVVIVIDVLCANPVYALLRCSLKRPQEAVGALELVSHHQSLRPSPSYCALIMKRSSQDVTAGEEAEPPRCQVTMQSMPKRQAQATGSSSGPGERAAHVLGLWLAARLSLPAPPLVEREDYSLYGIYFDASDRSEMITLLGVCLRAKLASEDLVIVLLSALTEESDDVKQAAFAQLQTMHPRVMIPYVQEKVMPIFKLKEDGHYPRRKRDRDFLYPQKIRKSAVKLLGRLIHEVEDGKEYIQSLLVGLSGYNAYDYQEDAAQVVEGLITLEPSGLLPHLPTIVDALIYGDSSCSAQKYPLLQLLLRFSAKESLMLSGLLDMFIRKLTRDTMKRCFWICC